MKILMINKFFYKRGGAEAYMFDLMELLKQEGHEVIEFSMKDEKNLPSKYENYFIENINFEKREGFWRDLKKACHLLYSFEVKNKLEALIKNEKPDIAHLHNFNFQLTPAIVFVLKKYKIPIVWTMHDYHLICPNYRLFTQGNICERCKINKFYNGYKYKCIKNSSAMSFLAMLEMYLHKVILKSYGKIDLFISPSKFLADKVKEWGIKTDKVEQLYNFINIDKLAPIDDIGEGLSYFGRLTEEKGLLTLLAAMKELPKINLKIVGTGPEEKLIKQYIEENKLTNVAVLGYQKGTGLYDLVKNSRLVIVPSIWYENNPITILEAFALAKPVIGSNLGGIPELVIDGKTGFLFKVGDVQALKNKILDHYYNTEIIKQLGQNARKFVIENFSAKSHLDKIREIYQMLIK